METCCKKSCTSGLGKRRGKGKNRGAKKELAEKRAVETATSDKGIEAPKRHPRGTQDPGPGPGQVRADPGHRLLPEIASAGKEPTEPHRWCHCPCTHATYPHSFSQRVYSVDAGGGVSTNTLIEPNRESGWGCEVVSKVSRQSSGRVFGLFGGSWLVDGGCRVREASREMYRGEGDRTGICPGVWVPQGPLGPFRGPVLCRVPPGLGTT